MADFDAIERWGYPEIALAANTDFDAVEAPGLFDTLAPTVTLVSPAPGTLIARSTPFVVDVQDENAGVFAALFVKVATSRLYEVAHDGEAFSYLYQAGSTRAAISGGYRFTLRREGGWPGAPTFTVRAFDGNMT